MARKSERCSLFREEKNGAQDWSRTSMLLALAPETSASTNSATWALLGCGLTLLNEALQTQKTEGGGPG